MNAQTYFSKSEAAAYTRLSARTLDSAKAKGDLPFYRVGSRKTLFRRDDLDRWLAPCRVEVAFGSGGR